MIKNVIFILSDQHNYKIMGKNDQYVRTPYLDSLVEKGTSFTNCYCASPLCVPSRVSMLTGLLPSKTEIINNAQALSSDTTTFAHAMGIAGYETVLCGRMHFNGPDQRHGFAQRLVGDITPTILGGIEDNYHSALEGTSGQRRVTIEKSGAGSSNVLFYDQAVRDAACQFIEKWDDSKPLFLLIGFYGPHCPYICSEALYNYYNNVLPEPDLFKEFKETVNPAIQKFYELRGLYNLSAEEVKRARTAYYGLVETLDGYVGDLVKAVEKTLKQEETLIIYASDHGDMIGENGLFWKTNFYDGSAKVPLVFSLPGHIPEGKEIYQVTSLLDIAPTLIDICGAPALPEIDGEDLLPLILGQTQENPERYIISQMGDIKGDNPSAMIRKGAWKLVSHYGYKQPQLFNMEDDPGEMHDLAGQKENLTIQEKLLKALDKHWDGKKFHQIAHKTIAHMKLLEAWVETTKAEQPEHWKGDVNNHYLL